MLLKKNSNRPLYISWAVCICVLSLSGRANLIWACDDSNHLTSCQTLLVFIRPYDYYVQLVYRTYRYLSVTKIRWTDIIYIGHHVSIEIKVVRKCKFHCLYLRNRKHVPCFYQVIQTRVEVWENEKCCGNTSRRRVFPQLFRVLPNFHECLYNSKEARSTCFLFLLENYATRKRKTTC